MTQAGVVILTAVTCAIAVIVPAQIQSTLDRGAREAVAEAGREADLLLRAPVADPFGGETATAERFLEFASEVPDRVPETLLSVSSSTGVGILSPEVSGAVSGENFSASVGVLDPQVAERVRTVEGVLPGAGEPPVSGGEPDAAVSLDVVVSTATAAALDLGVGDVLPIRGPASDDIDLRIIGIVEALDASDGVWFDLPGVWDPTTTIGRGDASTVAFTVLTDAAALDRAATRFREPSIARIRITFDPTLFDMRQFQIVGDAIDEIETSTAPISVGSPLVITATSGYEDSLSGFPSAAAAATNRLSTLAAGLLGVAVLVTVLAATALARRRVGEIDLLRARGASIGAIMLPAIAESIATVLLGGGIGIAATMVFGMQLDAVWLLVASVVCIGIAPIMVTLRQVIPAPSPLQARIVRIVWPAALVAVTVIAIVAVRSTGASSIEGPDPLVFAAPVLTAALVALALSPVYSPAIRLVTVIARRTRGAKAVLAASSARDGYSALTLVALTLASSVAITSVVLLESVASGAAGGIVADRRCRCARRGRRGCRGTRRGTRGGRGDLGGCRRASRHRVRGWQQVRRRDRAGSRLLTIPAFLAELPDGSASAAAVDRLLTPSGTPDADTVDALPALVDARLAELAGGETIRLEIEGVLVAVETAGTISLPNAESEPLAIVDRSRLADYLLAASDERSTDDTDAVPATTVLAIGERADTVSIPGESNEILRRSDVLSESRDGALVAGVASATAFSLLGTALLAALALVVTTVIGVRRRGRTLALLGALGASRRTGIALASGELAPLVIGGMLGGAFAAAGTLLAVGSALGVDIIAGGTAGDHDTDLASGRDRGSVGSGARPRGGRRPATFSPHQYGRHPAYRGGIMTVTSTLSRGRAPEFGTGALIACDSVVRVYRSSGVEVQALQGLDLLVQDGDMLAIVGASGSGQVDIARNPSPASMSQRPGALASRATTSPRCAVPNSCATGARPSGSCGSSPRATSCPISRRRRTSHSPSPWRVSVDGSAWPVLPSCSAQWASRRAPTVGRHRCRAESNSGCRSPWPSRARPACSSPMNQLASSTAAPATRCSPPSAL
jgi:putative ABC transport system permease protein